MTISLAANTFAYSTMYSSNSNIPDFSEVTNAELLGKFYESGANVYVYSLPVNSNLLYKYIDILNNNGYKVYAANDSNENEIDIGLYNASKGLYVNMYIFEYGLTLIIGK